MAYSRLTYNSRDRGIQCMPCFSRIICEMLYEIHIMENLLSQKTIISGRSFPIKHEPAISQKVQNE